MEPSSERSKCTAEQKKTMNGSNLSQIGKKEISYGSESLLVKQQWPNNWPNKQPIKGRKCGKNWYHQNITPLVQYFRKKHQKDSQTVINGIMPLTSKQMLQPQSTVGSTHYHQKNEKNRRNFLNPTFDSIVYIASTLLTPVDSSLFEKGWKIPTSTRLLPS